MQWKPDAWSLDVEGFHAEVIAEDDGTFTWTVRKRPEPKRAKSLRGTVFFRDGEASSLETAKQAAEAVIDKARG